MKYRSRRRPTEFPVLLLTETGEQVVDLLNISADGGRVRLKDPSVTPDDVVTLKIRDRHIGANIVWVRSGEAGLTFGKALPRPIFDLLTRRT